MRLEIVDRQANLSPTQRQLAERRLRFALTRFEPRIARVVLSVRDVNGPRGGPGIACQLMLYLQGGDVSVVSDLDVSMETAVSRVAERAGRCVARALERRRNERGLLSMAGDPHMPPNAPPADRTGRRRRSRKAPKKNLDGTA